MYTDLATVVFFFTGATVSACRSCSCVVSCHVFVKLLSK